MGQNQSTRKITVVNDEVSGVIKISDAVVQRLKGEITGGAAPEPAPTPAPAPAPPSEPKVEASPPPPPPVEIVPPPPIEAPPPVETPQPPPVEAVAELLPPPPASEPTAPPAPPAAVTEVAPPAPGPSHVWQRPIIQYIEEPSLSALRVRAEKEEELKRLEDYWKDRLQKQEVSISERNVLKDSVM